MTALITRRFPSAYVKYDRAAALGIAKKLLLISTEKLTNTSLASLPALK